MIAPPFDAADRTRSRLVQTIGLLRSWRGPGSPIARAHDDAAEWGAARSEAFFERHGPKAVFLARWVPVLRVTAAWLAGASRMRWPRFLLWNALGGAAWATSVALAAYLLGTAAAAILGWAGVAVVLLIAASASAVLLVRRRSRLAGAQ